MRARLLGGTSLARLGYASAGDVPVGALVPFKTNPGAGWQLADGVTNVPKTAATPAHNAPNYMGAVRFYAKDGGTLYRLILPGSGKTLQRSTDNGKTWVTAAATGLGTLVSVFCAGNGTLIVGGSQVNGTMWVSRDAGETFTTVNQTGSTTTQPMDYCWATPNGFVGLSLSGGALVKHAIPLDGSAIVASSLGGYSSTATMTAFYLPASGVMMYVVGNGTQLSYRRSIDHGVTFAALASAAGLTGFVSGGAGSTDKAVASPNFGTDVGVIQATNTTDRTFITDGFTLTDVTSSFQFTGSNSVIARIGDYYIEFASRSGGLFGYNVYSSTFVLLRKVTMLSTMVVNSNRNLAMSGVPGLSLAALRATAIADHVLFSDLEVAVNGPVGQPDLSSSAGGPAPLTYYQKL